MSSKQRISEIDYIRGWAILGILLVNVFSFSASDIFRDDFVQLWRSYPLEKVILFVRSNFLDNRIFPILSFLFGWGIGMQVIQKIRIKFLYRRQLVLLFFGLIHGLLIWWGDVLVLYAFCGLFTLLLRNQKSQLIWIVITILILFPFYKGISNPINVNSLWHYFNLNELNIDKLILILKPIDFTTFLKINFIEFINTNIRSTPFFLPKQLVMVLLGFLVSRKENFIKLLTSYSTKVGIYFILLSLILLRIAGYTFISGGINNPILFYCLEVTLRIVELSTSIIYLLIIYRIYSLRLGFTPIFVAVGQMSLTNYIFHSLIGLLIFHVFGLYGLLLPSRLLLTALMMFICTSIFSIFWLKTYQNGPLEYLLRKLMLIERK